MRTVRDVMEEQACRRTMRRQAVLARVADWAVLAVVALIALMGALRR